MKGLWTASDIEKGRFGSRDSSEENHLLSIMRVLDDHKEGLSNAEIDALLNNSSQWVAMWYLRELLAATFIEYKPQLFGEPGKYTITESGRALLALFAGEVHTGRVPSTTG